MTNPLAYTKGTSLLHRVHPLIKLVLAIGIIVATLCSHSLVLLALLLVHTLALGFSATVGKRIICMAQLLIPLAIIMFLLQTYFVPSGPVLFLGMTQGGMYDGARVSLRLVGIALPLVLMFMVTKPNDLANACVEQLHIPYPYAFTFTTVFRFVPLFAQEMQAIIEAQTARGVEFDSKNPIKKMQLMLPVIIPLLISSVAKTDASALSAEQRGFYLRGPQSSYKRFPLQALDWATIVYAVALVVIGIMF